VLRETPPDVNRIHAALLPLMKFVAYAVERHSCDACGIADLSLDPKINRLNRHAVARHSRYRDMPDRHTAE
jgi:hypothetical protein